MVLLNKEDTEKHYLSLIGPSYFYVFCCIVFYMDTQTDQPVVLMVTNNYFPYQGGVAQSIYASTQALQACGYTVIIVTLDVAGSFHDPSYVVRVPSFFRFTIKKNPVAFSLRITAYLKEVIHRYNPAVIHSHHPWILGTAAYKGAVSAACPIIFTHHTLYQEYAHYVPLPEQVTRFFITKQVRAYCQKMDHVIVPSPAVEMLLQRENITTPISVVPSAIRPCFFDSPHLEKRTMQLPLKLVYIGRVVREKNITALLDMLTLLAPSLYVFDCVGYGHQWQEIQEYAYRKLRLNHASIRFHHKPDEQTLLAWYRQADLFLFASNTDTQGLVLAEAMACKTPVIALEGPGQQAIMRNGYNGYVVKNIQEMAQSIVHIVQHPELLQQLSQGAYTTSLSYSIQEHGKQLHALYTSIIKKEGPAHK